MNSEELYIKKFLKYENKIASLRKILMKGGKADEQFCPNDDLVTVKFGDLVINNGDVIPLEKVQTKPDLSFQTVDHDLYTILMVDPDAPNGYWLHWMKINSAEEVKDFQPSNPLKGSGPHRYYFKIYKQSYLIDSNIMPKYERAGFDPSAFISKYKLELVACIHYVSESN